MEQVRPGCWLFAAHARPTRLTPRRPRLAFFPLALLYTAGAGSMYYVCVVFFPSLKAFNAALHSVLLLDVLLGTFSATVSLLFIYSYYVPPKRGVRDLCMLETLYRKIKKLPRDLAVHTRGHGQQRHSVGPAANMLGLDADLEEELAFQEESSRRVSVSGSPRSDPWRVEMNRVDEATLARERVLAESDRRIARRWVVIEWAVVGLTAGACLIRLVDDYLTIHPLWTEAESAPYAVYQLSSIFFQAGNSIAVGFHALHCVALASILDLLSRRVRGGAVPPVRYMQLTLDFMHELRKHNRSWGNAVVLAGTFYTFEGVVTLFGAMGPSCPLCTISPADPFHRQRPLSLEMWISIFYVSLFSITWQSYLCSWCPPPSSTPTPTSCSTPTTCAASC